MSKLGGKFEEREPLIKEDYKNTILWSIVDWFKGTKLFLLGEAQISLTIMLHNTHTLV